MRRREALILLSALVLIVLFWAMTAWDLRRAETRAYVDSERIADGLAAGYAEQVAAQLRRGEATAREIARQAAADPQRPTDEALASSGGTVVAVAIHDRRGGVLRSLPRGQDAEVFPDLVQQMLSQPRREVLLGAASERRSTLRKRCG